LPLWSNPFQLFKVITIYFYHNVRYMGPTQCYEYCCRSLLLMPCNGNWQQCSCQRNALLHLKCLTNSLGHYIGKVRHQWRSTEIQRSVVEDGVCQHQQNLDSSRKYTQTSQVLRLTALVLSSTSSETNLHSVRQTWVFPSGLTALTKTRTLGQSNTHFPLHT